MGGRRRGYDPAGLERPRGARQEHRTLRVRSLRWHRRRSRLQPTAWPSAVARSPWRATSGGGGTLDRADRRAARPITDDREGLHVRSDWREGAGGQGPLRRLCRGCGAYTQPRNGKGDAYAYRKACHPGAIERRWTRERVVEAMLDRRSRYARLPSSYDWSRTHARRRGGEAFKRLADGEWPASSVVTRLFCTWAVARATASRPNVAVPTRRPSATSRLGSNSIPLPNPRESTAKSEDLRGGEEERQQRDLQGFSVWGVDFAHNSGREVPGSNPGAPIGERPC
jgi:hypothetical protein